MSNQLLEHELEAAEIIAQQPRVLLFDAMGVGKTVSVLNGLKMASGGLQEPVKCVVCAPNTLLGQWVDEIGVWLPEFKSVVAVGNKQQRELKYDYFVSVNENVILLTNYSLLVKDWFFSDLSLGGVLILDEGYLIRNRNTKIYGFLKSFVDKFSKVIILSGNTESFTPEQFYNMADLLFPGLIEKGTKESIQKSLGKGYISRDFSVISSDVKNVEVPEINYVPLELSGEQKSLLSDLAVQENKAMKTSTYNARYFYQKRLEVLNSPKILDASLSNSPKELFLVATLKTLKEKVVIYCQDRKFFKILKSDLNNAGVDFVAVSGEMPIHIRDRNLNLFRLDKKVSCLLLSGVGKFGLNLQVANVLVCMGVPKSEFDLMQVIGRLDRINQKERVVCYIPYHLDTIEEKWIKKLQ